MDQALQDAITISIKLALCSTFILLFFGTLIAWKLSTWQSKFKPIIEAIITLPYVLPPTVIGFYLLTLMSADSHIGELWGALFGTPLAFSFSSLVVGSVVYSFPFVIQPLQAGFEQIPKNMLESAQTLGASPRQLFLKVILPLNKPLFVVAGCLGFAHALGEFGIILMLGGNIQGETQTISILLYDKVESFKLDEANDIALTLALLSVLLLSVIYAFKSRAYKFK